jgi:hypothetical protein
MDVVTEFVLDQINANAMQDGTVPIAQLVKSIVSLILINIAICDPPCAHGQCVGPNSCDCALSGYANCPLPPNVCGCDEDECLRANKVCDPLSSCTNTIGNYTCSPCPIGYAGTPYLTYPDWKTGNFSR